MTPEFSRTVRIDTLGAAPRDMEIEADAAERAALAHRFGLASLDRLSAAMTIVRRGEEIVAAGRVRAALAQYCVATEEPVAAEIDERFEILFRPHPAAEGEEEIEIGGSELDVVFYDGALIDVGEAAAETMALSLDPFPRSPAAAEALRQAGVLSEEEAKPAGPLAGLKDLLGKK